MFVPVLITFVTVFITALINGRHVFIATLITVVAVLLITAVTVFITMFITMFISAAVAGGRWSLAAWGAVGAERGAGPRATIGAATVFAGPAGDARERTIAVGATVRAIVPVVIACSSCLLALTSR